MAEPVAWLYTEGKDATRHLSLKRQAISPEDASEFEITETPLYAQASPAPDDMREAVAAIIALHGLGTSNGTDRLTPPGTWEQAEWEARILAVIPGLAERRCYALADAILALTKDRTHG